MSNYTSEQRSAIMSARAKNRKAATALLTADVAIPKAIAAHMKAVEDWANKAIAPAAKKADKKAA